MVLRRLSKPRRSDKLLGAETFGTEGIRQVGPWPSPGDHERPDGGSDFFLRRGNSASEWIKSRGPKPRDSEREMAAQHPLTVFQLVDRMQLGFPRHDFAVSSQVSTGLRANDVAVDRLYNVYGHSLWF